MMGTKPTTTIIAVEARRPDGQSFDQSRDCVSSNTFLPEQRAGENEISSCGTVATREQTVSGWIVSVGNKRISLVEDMCLLL
jgi:hypothetical protein